MAYGNSSPFDGADACGAGGRQSKAWDGAGGASRIEDAPVKLGLSSMREMPDPRVSLELFAAFSAGLLGLIVGSFGNVVIYRLPLQQSVAFPASHCPRCHAAIRPWQNIPLISWLLLRGRCASCRAPISMRYPVVEALHGVGFSAIVLRFGLNPFTPVLLLFFFALLVLAFIDWDHQILPDAITLPMIGVGLASSLLRGSLVGWKESMIAAAFGYLSFFVIAEGYARLRGIEGLGMGDWKLAALLGAFLGFRSLLLVVFLASVSGIVYGLTQAIRLRHRLPLPSEGTATLVEPVAPAPEAEPGSEPTAPADTLEAAEEPPASIGRYKLPFGTFLAGAAVVVLMRGDALLHWYGSFFLP